MMMTYYLNIGSNLDDREGNLWAADLRLSLDLGLVTARSTIVGASPGALRATMASSTWESPWRAATRPSRR